MLNPRGLSPVAPIGETRISASGMKRSGKREAGPRKQNPVSAPWRDRRARSSSARARSSNLIRRVAASSWRRVRAAPQGQAWRARGRTRRVAASARPRTRFPGRGRTDDRIFPRGPARGGRFLRALAEDAKRKMRTSTREKAWFRSCECSVAAGWTDEHPDGFPPIDGEAAGLSGARIQRAWAGERDLRPPPVRLLTVRHARAAAIFGLLPRLR